MLRHPETVVAKAIHQRGHGLGLAQCSCEVGVRITPLVDGRSAIPDVVEVGMTGIEAVKLGDHREFSVPYQPRPDCRISNYISFTLILACLSNIAIVPQAAGGLENVSSAAETFRLGPRGRGPHSGR